jgi:DNA-directed RNA polymerase subunit RPC12/RpoP
MKAGKSDSCSEGGIKMFKIICSECGKENNISKDFGTVDTDNDIVIGKGDYIIEYIECPCGNKIESDE